jgi:hypothetical protein
MASNWETEMVRLLRHLINDLDSSDETYDQDRLEETILVSAQLLQEEVDWSKTYTVELDQHSLSPDPAQSTKDDAFINLVCLKAAVIILTGEAKKLAGQSYRVVDGPSSIDVRGAYDGIKEMLDSYKDDLAIAVAQYKMGNSKAGEAILTPYTQIRLGINSIF